MTPDPAPLSVPPNEPQSPAPLLSEQAREEAVAAAANALLTATWGPDGPTRAHKDHDYYAFCEVCSGNVDAMAEVAVPAALASDRVAFEVRRLRSSADVAHEDFVAMERAASDRGAEVRRLTSELEEARAHDRWQEARFEEYRSEVHRLAGALDEAERLIEAIQAAIEERLAASARMDHREAVAALLVLQVAVARAALAGDGEPAPGVPS